METVQYIVTVELWFEGKAARWEQFAVGVCTPVLAEELLEKIRIIALDGYDKKNYTVKITDIVKL